MTSRTFQAGSDYKLPGYGFGLAPATNINNPGTPGGNGTSSSALYQSALYDQQLDFHFTVPNGAYTVLLHFATDNPTVGARVFDVFIENALVDDNLDIAAVAAGANKALVRSYTTTVTGNDLSVYLKTELTNAIIQGIEIIPIGVAPTTIKNVTMKPTVSGCYFTGGTSKATVNVETNWAGALPNETITIKMGAQTRTINPGGVPSILGFK